ncbi:hypothetical protein E2N92_12155 [Methanofollis formosanus]|uniref:Uncharacterized protein n=1 Tax=Methanofollis formosanus TaxID=299308 RepID=A0A8G1A3X7_9EURY|nr:hypothetical protein [Methanofollis formosanus]QYZ80125.1 hypothetical protein E2N92_12155 [Methanofollis formosanus]
MTKRSQKRRDGSPQTEDCSNTGSRRSAISQSSREDVKSVGPVPLYLVPPVVTAAVNRVGGALSELCVRRSGMHLYTVRMTVLEEEA